MLRTVFLLLAAGLAWACHSVVLPPAAPPPPFRMVLPASENELAGRLEALSGAATADVERFFGAPFPSLFTVTVFSDRSTFDASFPPEWGIGKSECWMVATGVADGVRLLSPRVWKVQACEHDPEDELHLRRLLTHELVHVYHGQLNPSPDFLDVSGIDWFVEGLATFASGQLEDPALASAREALDEGAGPTTLANAWSGRYRYGVSGSLVAFVDHELGRARLNECLAVSSSEELLALLGMEEPHLLSAWRAFVERTP